MGRWSERDRRHGLSANDLDRVERWWIATEDAAPIIRNGESVRAVLLGPEAVEVLLKRGAAFKGIAYALATVTAELDDWRRSGPPGTRAENGRPKLNLAKAAQGITR